VGVAVLACAATAQAAVSPARDPNPCLTPEKAELRCPDLRMEPPFGLYADGVTHPGRVLLRAGNSIDNVGSGPAELHGARSSRYLMRARQRIYRKGGGRKGVRTGGHLYFKYAHQHRRWWKFQYAARFELWRLDRTGRRVRRVRKGPKVDYCLRDLKHTHPGLRRSPRHRVYPACSSYFGTRRITLGTSVGWSDVYPPDYPEQWIDVTGLRGCFSYVHRADPHNRIYESNEDNNEGHVVVRLPFRPGRPSHCRGGGAAPPRREDSNGGY
jgi:Lysyl oxidase